MPPIEKATRTSNGGGIATGLATTISGERYWHHLHRGRPHEGPVFADRDRGDWPKIQGCTRA